MDERLDESAGKAVLGGQPRQTNSRARRARLWSTLRARIPFLLALVLIAFGLRVGAAVAFDQYLNATGRGGFLSEDEFGYDRVAWAQAQAWRGVGASVNPDDSYLLNSYTYTEAAVYVVVGHRPLAMKLINCLFGALAAGLVFLIARQLFGQSAARVSGLAAAFFPTTFFFSIVNLKDAMFLFVASVLLWQITVLLSTAWHWLVLPVLTVLVVVGGLRTYIQGVFVALVPVAVALQDASRFPRKWLTSAVLFVGCVAIFWYSGGAQWLIGYVPSVNQQRFASSLGARSAYVVLPTVATTAAMTNGGGAAPGVRNGGAAVSGGGTGVGGGRSAVSSPTPWSRPSDPLAVPTTMPPPTRGSASVRSLLAWLPIGVVFAIAAPFPWAARRAIEQLTIPEMLLWYALLVLAILGAVIHRRKWRSYVHLVGYIGGILLIFAIGQGNLGTLIRQRSMMIAPFVFVFSGAGVVWLCSRLKPRRA